MKSLFMPVVASILLLQGCAMKDKLSSLGTTPEEAYVKEHGKFTGISESKVKNTINLYGTVAIYPSSLWFDDSDESKLLEQNEYYKKQTGPHFMLEMIPKGESFDSWTQMYKIEGLKNHPKGDPEKMPRSLMNFWISLYNKGCAKEDFAVLTFSKNPKNPLMGIVCTDTKDYGMKGYGEGIATLAIMHFNYNERTTVGLSYELRTKSYDVSDPKTWPLTEEQVKGVAEYLSNIELVNKEDAKVPVM